MSQDETAALDRYFKEGLAARDAGQGLHDNPYAAGSQERREWSAGFRATASVVSDAEETHDSTGGSSGRTLT